MNILVVTAHHDDLELGCGGTVARFLEQGHRVVSLVLTHSGYKNSNGEVVRGKEQAIAEGVAAAQKLGYELVAYEEDSMDLPLSDANACKIVDAVSKYQISALFTHWPGDTHPVHQRVTTMAIQASRKVPRVFGFAVNWYIGMTPFHPTTFVRLEERHWQRKIAALSCYESEFGRAGKSWVEYLDRQALNFGVQVGVPRAEGFVTIKNLMEIGRGGD